MANTQTPWLRRRLKLSHHRHTGKVLPRQHTSHGVLLLLLIVAGVLLAVYTKGLIASAQSLNSSGSINAFGTVPGPPPSQPAKILAPTNGQVFKSQNIDVSGLCPDGTFIEIYKNNILAGATACQSGVFGLKVDLVIGANRLIAKDKDNLDQYGPDSQPVDVSFQPNAAPLSTAGLLVVTDSQYFGQSSGQPMKLGITVTGGKVPYAVDVDWGDHKHDLISRSAAGRFEIQHTYAKGGIYNLQISVSDAAGNQAMAQSVALIGGQPSAYLAGGSGTIIQQYPLIEAIWPIYVVSLGVVAAFWLGEKFTLIHLIKR